MLLPAIRSRWPFLISNAAPEFFGTTSRLIRCIALLRMRASRRIHPVSASSGEAFRSDPIRPFPLDGERVDSGDKRLPSNPHTSICRRLRQTDDLEAGGSGPARSSDRKDFSRALELTGSSFVISNGVGDAIPGLTL